MAKNPFPGMNPYLEASWGDVHSSLVIYSRDQINEQLPEGLQARVEESVSVAGDDEDSVSVAYPDARIVERNEWSYDAEATPGGIAVATPIYIALQERPTERHIEIVDISDGARVITAIEFLSLSNKIGRGRDQYRRKQERYLDSGINLVEVDLLRDGLFVLAIDWRHVPLQCRGPYHCCVRRALVPNRAEMFPMPLRAALPSIPIPLRPHDHDVALQLQVLVDDAIRKGRYSNINYQLPPEPPLEAEDAQWVDSLLRERGLRK